MQRKKIKIIRGEPEETNQQEPAEIHYAGPPLSLKERIIFEGSLAYTNFKSQVYGTPKWAEVVPHVLLGQVLTVEDSKKLLEDYPKLKAVFTCLRPDEAQGKTVFFDPKLQTPSGWKELGVKPHLLSIKDFSADISVKKILEIVEEMHQVISQGFDVYLHCKAGVGRSATICACYLLIYGSGDESLKPGATIEEVIAFISEKRQISLKPHNIEKIKEFLKFYEEEKTQKLERKSTETEISFREKLNNYCGSYKGIQSIIQLPALQALETYAQEKEGLSSHRSQFIYSFLKDILDADDGSWYIDFVNNEGSMKELIDNVPYHGLLSSGPPATRQSLINNLKKELQNLLQKEIKCTEKDIQSLIMSNEIPEGDMTFNLITPHKGNC